ncbi:di-N-acetylchitobiase-like [Leucoraja erinacea]|uniref:di-N-acetylchitobiase-like n=1 Tax=Leucoraja erinaceus TaxID=7782 RepID=UPI0024558B35|nr:di-N-acetylchitobiase-like [Leucoraja erinacea]
MCTSVAGLLSLAVLALWVTSSSCIENCHCLEPTHCRHLSARRRYPVQLFAFHSGVGIWKHYDWSKITTIVTSGLYDPDLMCHAHAHKARVVTEEPIGKNELVDIHLRSSWISNKLHKTRERYLDGIHLRFGTVLDATVSAKLPSLIKDIKTRFTRSIPGSQVKDFTKKFYSVIH